MPRLRPVHLFKRLLVIRSFLQLFVNKEVTSGVRLILGNPVIILAPVIPTVFERVIFIEVVLSQDPTLRRAHNFTIFLKFLCLSDFWLGVLILSLGRMSYNIVVLSVTTGIYVFLIDGLVHNQGLIMFGLFLFLSDPHLEVGLMLLQ